MFIRKDEIDIHKLVTFYSIFTSVYASLLLFMLYWTDWIYYAGKYEFNRVMILIIAAELFKYISSITYFRNSEYCKKLDDKLALLKNIISRTKVKEGFKNVAVVLVMILVYFGIAILYGAEVFKKHEETFMFSSLLSVLTIFPACINLGSHSVLALVLGTKPINKLEGLMYQNLYLTVLGAWLGAFVIPLDWDRPWQEWPISCSFGAMAGFAISHLVMTVKVKGCFKKKYKPNV